MNGPVAPKDPEKNRSFFYIMKQKEIYGSKEKDGTGIQFLYQSDRRLRNSAEIVGTVTDEKMLSMLETVEGFRKLVHSIGVSVEMDNPNQTVTFVFQMYGKKDLYGGGTNVGAKLRADGTEERIHLSEIEWKEDDDVPGQIKVHMPHSDEMGNITVRLYLNDGYEAPAQDEEAAVDTESDNYRNMIARSLVSKGNTTRLAQKLGLAMAGEKIVVGYIGGSITQGAGATPINTECYAYKSFMNLKQLVNAGNNLEFRKAGVGGTPSELGMVRFDRDLVRGKENPDIVIVEFAVNDEGDETKGKCYESLVRKISNLPNKPAVILLFSVFADDFNLEERLSPVGRIYDLPMVSIKQAVTPQFTDKSNRVLTKNQFFYDIFHPSNLGHTIMADCLTNLFSEVLLGSKTSSVEFDVKKIEPVIGADFERIIFFDKKDVYASALINEGGFVYTDENLQMVEMDDNIDTTPEFPYNWMYDGSKNTNGMFSLDISCKALVVVFKDCGEIDTAKAKAYVDGRFVRELDPYVNGWVHCNPVILIQEESNEYHHVEIKIDEEFKNNKFTILGFGYVE